MQTFRFFQIVMVNVVVLSAVVSAALPNRDKSAARFCCQVAAWITDMSCNFYFVKSHKIVNNSAKNEVREKISTDLESLVFFDVCLTKFENYQILLNKLAADFY
jgi:hypothetical protein